MKKNTTQQANSRFHSEHQGAANGLNTYLRLLLLLLLCGSVSVGTVAWGQTRGGSTSSSRSTTRSSSASDARTERNAADTRTEKKEADTRTERKAAETRSTESRNKSESSNKQEEDKKKESTRNKESDERRETSNTRESVQQNTSRQGSETRQAREIDAGERSTRGSDIRQPGQQGRPNPQVNDRRGGSVDNSRVAPNTRQSSGYRLVPGNRNPDRKKIQLPDIRFKHDRERCVLCFGVGFIYTQDRLHRLRCSHCYGRGFELEFISRLDDVCPICYGPVAGYGPLNRRSIQNTANYVVDRLDFILDLSRSQERAIKRIVLDYLRDSRYDGWYNPVVLRDRAIMRELSFRQRDMYMDFMNNVDSRDLCDRCFDYF